MRPLHWIESAALAAVILGAIGCERSTAGLDPVPPNTDPVVFSDNFGDAIDFQAFSGSKLDAVAIDPVERFQGTASLKVTVPGSGAGGYSGGAFTTTKSRDLSSYNALSFWAKAGKAARLDVAGLGNDNTGTSKYEASWKNIALTTTWAKYVVPIPLPERLGRERGLFFFAEGPEGTAPYDIWFDEVQFETIAGIANPRPSMSTRTVGGFIGAAVPVEGTRTIFSVNGVDQTIEHMPGYFTYQVSDENVATVTDGVIRVTGGGHATITGKLGTVDVNGTVTLNTTAPPAAPAPAPTLPAGDVISLFSNAYPNVPVTKWSADWDQADVTDLKISGNDTKAYTNLVYAGIEFTQPVVNAAAMTHFHIDVWAAEGTYFRVKLVDFGEDGTYGGAPDAEYELTFNASSSPPFTPGTWASLDIPLADFLGLVTREHMAQLIISGDGKTVFVDNVYFHK